MLLEKLKNFREHRQGPSIIKIYDLFALAMAMIIIIMAVVLLVVSSQWSRWWWNIRVRAMTDWLTRVPGLSDPHAESGPVIMAHCGLLNNDDESRHCHVTIARCCCGEFFGFCLRILRWAPGTFCECVRDAPLSLTTTTTTATTIIIIINFTNSSLGWLA